jgi:AraC-like DNA-binding protein
MSRSQLYRLFEPAGGAGREIQRERLRQAHRAIADPDEQRTIHEIGGDLGFAEPTTFSRAFRRHFGYPPSALRRAPQQPSQAVAARDGDAFLGAPGPG